MGKLKSKAKKLRDGNRINRKNRYGGHPLNKRQKQLSSRSLQYDDPILFGSDTATSGYHKEEPTANAGGGSKANNGPSRLDPEDLHRLLEPYSKDQLISFLAEAAVENTDVLSHIHSVADRDVSHRKIFVHGLAWDATRENLFEAFRPYGSVEECNVVVDKSTGRGKGYGFVLFTTRAGAEKALKDPNKKVGSRYAACQLASIGPVVSSGGSAPDIASRRIFVSNVHPGASPDKLKFLFARYGEIEAGPLGFDTISGKSRGFAIFVYKTQEGASRALQEPYKMFEGHQLHCQLAIDYSQKGKAPYSSSSSSTAPQNLAPINQQPAVGAVVAAHNLSLLGQNPTYSMYLSQNPLLTAAALNPTALAAFNPSALAAWNPSAALIPPQGQGYGGIGIGAVNAGSTIPSAYGSQGSAVLPYVGSQMGQPSSVTSANGLLRGFPQ
ncbi:Heterogeneous nuclear ribonucleoprotein 1 [Apostasia shenzhenica]|uniref:Heterogeneous nuclear ribonucleoprotein 1 n=1 Tax=Apostasia shenzhenica TaxID=1088818 RepID=A0A2I0A0M2_9ASPA|nr:Heterogeneous nuclear ribonucleoprotein 1 [Apostasia shenzhenica]